MKPPRHEGLILTDRDKTIIRSVYKYRFLTTDQIQMLTASRSRNKLNDRLRKLWGNDYLDRPEYTLKMFAYEDRRPTVHALGNAGAMWLAEPEHDGVQFPKTVDWRAKNKAIKSTDFVLHTLGVTQTMVQALCDVRPIDGIHIIDRDEVWLRSPSFSPTVEMPFQLPTELHWIDGRVISRKTIPDYVFSLGDTRTGKLRRGLNFLEYDRGTEDFVRSSPYQSSILQKFLGYVDAYERGIHMDRFGYKRFRVLFVTEGDKDRIENMIGVYSAHASGGIPSGAFLFTTTKKLEAEGFLAPIWMDAARNETALIDDITPLQSSSRALSQSAVQAL